MNASELEYPMENKWTPRQAQSLKLIVHAFELQVLSSEQALRSLNDPRTWIPAHPQDPPELWINRGDEDATLIHCRVRGVNCVWSANFTLLGKKNLDGKWDTELQVQCLVSAKTTGKDPALGVGNGGDWRGVPEAGARHQAALEILKVALKKSLQRITEHTNFEKESCEAVAKDMDKWLPSPPKRGRVNL